MVGVNLFKDIVRVMHGDMGVFAFFGGGGDFDGGSGGDEGDEGEFHFVFV